MNYFNTDKDTANIIKKYEGHNIDILTCAKTKADVKGGTIIDYEGRVGCQTVNAWIQRGVEIVTGASSTPGLICTSHCTDSSPQSVRLPSAPCSSRT